MGKLWETRGEGGARRHAAVSLIVSRLSIFVSETVSSGEVGFLRDPVLLTQIYDFLFRFIHMSLYVRHGARNRYCTDKFQFSHA